MMPGGNLLVLCHGDDNNIMNEINIDFYSWNSSFGYNLKTGGMFKLWPWSDVYVIYHDFPPFLIYVLYFFVDLIQQAIKKKAVRSKHLVSYHSGSGFLENSLVVFSIASTFYHVYCWVNL